MLPYKNFSLALDNECDYIPHIYPLTKNSFPNIERGQYINGIFEPPSLDLYTQMSLQSYFLVFWGMLLLQTLAILTVDKILVKNIPQNTNLWDRILHSIQKSSYPFPYTHWHEENGSCLQHLKRKKLVDQEVLITIIVNLVFNMILLFPLPVFCKILFLMFSLHLNHAWLTR